MAAGQYKTIFTIERATEGQANQSQITFDSGGNALDHTQAKVLRMLVYMGQAMGGDVSVVGMSIKELVPRARTLDQPFPGDRYQALCTAEGVPSQGAGAKFPFALSFAGHTPAPIGTSVSIGRRSNNAAALGREGAGRFYLPFVGSHVVGTDGTLTPQWASWMESLHRWFLMNSLNPANTVPPLEGPVSAASIPGPKPAYVDQYVIVGNVVKNPSYFEVDTTHVSRTLSNLRSRRR
jgi:hypothetical protein